MAHNATAWYAKALTHAHTNATAYKETLHIQPPLVLSLTPPKCKGVCRNRRSRHSIGEIIANSSHVVDNYHSITHSNFPHRKSLFDRTQIHACAELTAPMGMEPMPFYVPCSQYHTNKIVYDKYHKKI